MAKILNKSLSKKARNIAIIMDGNGRWAISNSFNISKGHSKGVEVVREIVEESVKQNISSLTLYAFSSENWSRPKAEVEAIKKLVVKAINDQVPELIEQKVKLKFFGRIDDFGKNIVTKIQEAEEATSCKDASLNLNVALFIVSKQSLTFPALLLEMSFSPLVPAFTFETSIKLTKEIIKKFFIKDYYIV